MNRAYYSGSIANFLNENINSIRGQVDRSHDLNSLVKQQGNAWDEQIKILQKNLQDSTEKFILNFQFQEWESELITYL